MSQNELINLILSSLLGGITSLLALVGVYLVFPDKLEKVGSIVFKLLAYFNKRSEKIYIATNIQSSIDENRKKLGAGGEVLSHGLQIKWTEEESAEVDLQENNVIVMMRPFQSQAKNYAHVVSLYVPKALLPRARRYVHPDVRKGIDYTISKNLLEKNPTALGYYQDRELETHTEEVKEAIRMIEPIDAIGRLSRIIIQEYKTLHLKYPNEPDLELYNETMNLLRTLSDFESSLPGKEEGTTGIFNEKQFKMCVVPIGKSHKLRLSGVEEHLDFIGKQMTNGVERFYIVSAGNNPHAIQLVELACIQYSLNKIFEEEYDGVFRGRPRRMYCSLCVREN